MNAAPAPQAAASDVGPIDPAPAAVAASEPARRFSRRAVIGLVTLGVIAAVVVAIAVVRGGEASAQARLESAVVKCDASADYVTEFPGDNGETVRAPQLNIELYGEDAINGEFEKITCISKEVMSDSTYLRLQRTSLDDPMSVTENGLFIYFEFDSNIPYLYLSISLA